VIGWTIWVHYPSITTWGWHMNFFPWWWQHAYPHLNIWQREKQIDFERVFQKDYMATIFLASSLICLLIRIGCVWNIMQSQVWVHGCLFAWLSFFPIGFKHFFHYIVHSIGPPPSFSPWLVTLHLWPTFKPYGDPYSLLCRWWGEDNFPWCCVGCLCMYHEGCKISCFTWVDPYCALSYNLCVDMLTFWFWWMVFGWMFTNVIITNPTWVHLVSQVVLSCEIVAKLWLRLRGWPLSWLILKGHVSPSSHKGLWMFASKGQWFFFWMC